MKVLFRSTLVFLLLLCADLCLGSTLYERSLVQFKAKAQTASPQSYTFVVLGDSRGGDAVFARALRLARSFKPLFVLHGGDYSDHGGKEETRNFLWLVQGNLPDVPMFVIMGNHENRDVFTKKIGPPDFTLQSKRLGITLVALDNSGEVLKPSQLDYLRNQLGSADGAKFVAMHVPPKTRRWTWHTFSEGAEQLEKIVSRGRLQGAFFSHVHLYDRSEFGGVPALITGGAGATLVSLGFPGTAVYHILVVRVTDGKASFSMVPIPRTEVGK